MNTYNMCFYGEIRKTFSLYPLLIVVHWSQVFGELVSSQKRAYIVALIKMPQRGNPTTYIGGEKKVYKKLSRFIGIGNCYFPMAEVPYKN